MNGRRLLTLAALTCACSAAGEGTSGGASYEVGGRAQKGPFISGSAVDVSELEAGLTQTGLTFSTTIDDDTGVFSVNGVELSNPVARVSVDGFYFNEVSGELSDARLELNAFVDLSSAEAANVNILGHLEAPRIEYLVSEEGLTFADAQLQAHEELLSAFTFDASGVGSAESLDIAGGGAGNAKLLAISILTQGFGSVAQLTEKLSAIQTDLRTDGTLDSPTTGAELMNVALSVDAASIRENLETRYLDLGLNVTIPDFESELQHFVDNAPFEPTPVEYPSAGSGGCVNLLEPMLTQADPAGSHCLVVDVPEGRQLRFVIENVSADPKPYFFFGGSDEWGQTLLDNDGHHYELVPPGPGLQEIPQFGCEAGCVVRFDYFETGQEMPDLSKQVSW